MDHTVKVTLSDGDHWSTGINGTREEVTAYFMGQRFEGWDDATGREYMRAPVVSVEFL